MAAPPLYLVSCTKLKADRPCAARDLYTPSDWFAKARAYVEARAGDWRILSAKHGLLHPDQVVAPYETTLLRMGAAERWAWASVVWRQLQELQPPIADRHVVMLAGARYRENLEAWIVEAGGPGACVVPMRGLALGQQKAWLAREGALTRTAAA